MNFLKRISLIELFLVVVILSIHLYAAGSDAHNFPNMWYSRDDAYYYFKVAQNITEGAGSTFDGINTTNGYHPLWMIVCIPIFAFARFDLILPLRIMLMVMAGFNAATTVLIYRLVKRNLSETVAVIAATFWAFNYYIHSTVYEFGLETPLAAFLIVLLIWKLSVFETDWQIKKASNRQIAILGIIGTLVMFSRLDLIFLALISGIWIIFRGKSIRFLLPLDLVVILFSLTFSVAYRVGIEAYNQFYAGTAIAVSFLSAIVKITCLYFFGLYQHPRDISVWKTIKQISLALGTSLIVTISLYLLMTELNFFKSFPRSAFALDWGISFIFIITIRLVAYWAVNNKSLNQKETPWGEIKLNWKHWLADGKIYYGIVAGTLSVYMLINKIFFGTATPVSGQIKRWWGSITKTPYELPAGDWPSFFGFNSQGAFSAWKPASDVLFPLGVKLRPYFPGADYVDERYYIGMFFIFVLAVIFLAFNIRSVLDVITKMPLVPLLAGSAIQIFSYTTTAYGGAKEWYWVSQMILITLVGSLFLYLLILQLERIKTIRLFLEFASLTICVYTAYLFSLDVRANMPYNAFPGDMPFMDVLPFLENNTPPGSIIGMTGGGNVSYFIKDRTIVNMDGLINSYDYFLALQKGEGPSYLREHGLQIVFANTQLLSTPPYYGQFNPYLSNFGDYGGKGLFYLLDKPKY